MPYIEQSRRDKLDPFIKILTEEIMYQGFEIGDLNYIIYNLVLFYFRAEKRYKTIAGVTGVLENVKQEFYRKIAASYEDEAIEKNGDIS